MINVRDNELLMRCSCWSSSHIAWLIHEPTEERGNNLKGIDDDWYLSVTLDGGSVGSCNDVGEPKINYEMRTGTVNLIGDIADLWDGPLEGSTVTITNLKSRKTLVVSTAKNGQFQTADLEPGKYSLKASHDGYEELSKFTFWVTDNNLTRLGPVYIVKKYESRVWLCL